MWRLLLLLEHLLVANKQISRPHHLLSQQLHHQCSHPLPLHGPMQIL
jgi:hypothetical protein